MSEIESKYLSALQEIEQKKKEKDAVEKREKQELEKIKVAMNNLFSRPDGILVGKAIMNFCGLYKLKKNNNNLFEMGKERGKEELYLKLFKGMLRDDILANIENKD